MKLVLPMVLRFLTNALSDALAGTTKPRVELDMLSENSPEALVASVLETINVPFTILRACFENAV